MRLIDSHSHFDDECFNADRPAAIARAQAVGVTAQVVPGICAGLWPRLRQVCAEHRSLHPAYGLHPVYLAAHRPADLEALAVWIEREKPVAVGEIGLDYYLEGLDRNAQKHFFAAQLDIARAACLPVIVHARHAVEDCYLLLRQFKGVLGVVHSFSGSDIQARRLIELGYYLGFGGPVTYPGAHRLHALVRTLPLDNLLLETDAPDQPAVGHRGGRNEPAFLPDILHEVARLRGDDPAHVAAVTTDNARRLFRLGEHV